MFQNLPPLAERMRPKTLQEVVGQEHLLGETGPVSRAIRSGQLPSILFWGPPGVGKTTIARLLAKETGRPYFQLSAIDSGVKEIRQVIEQARQVNGALLFIDEIHRFNKGQQDALLGAVESGTITLIGATTENPSFEVNNALLSRCQVYILKELGKESLEKILHHALSNDEVLKQANITLSETDAMLVYSGGDARKLLNILDLCVAQASGDQHNLLTNALVEKTIQQKTALFDKSGDLHYDIISAFIKSIRGSDPQAALYYLARMTAGGEDPKFIARRLVILASEDIGNANPNALLLATSCFEAVNLIGYPECELTLAQCVIYLATSPKSNSVTIALMKAKELVQETGELPVPLHLRNAPTKLMRELNYGKGYRYPHDFPGNFTPQEYLPDALKNRVLYEPGTNAREQENLRFLQKIWAGKYGYPPAADQ